MRQIFGLLMALMILGSCSNKQSVQGLAGNWEVVEASGFGIHNPEATIAFDIEKDLAYGNLGCSAFMVGMVLESGQLTIEEIKIPFEVCDKVEQEQLIKGSLGKVVGYELSSDKQSLSLLNADGEVAVLLTKLSDVLPETPVLDPEELEYRNVTRYETLPADSLVGSWEVVSIGNNGQLSEEKEHPFMIIDVAEKTVNGNLGCNSFGARLELGEPNHIQFVDAFSTRMMCEDMSMETTMGFALRQVSQYGFNPDGTVWLLQEDGTRLLLLRRKE